MTYLDGSEPGASYPKHTHQWAPQLIDSINRPPAVLVNPVTRTVSVTWRRGEGCCFDDVVREVTTLYDYAGNVLDEHDPAPTILQGDL